MVIAVLAAVQCPQVGQPAPGHAVVDAHLAGMGRIRPEAHGHVLKIGLVSRRPAAQKHLRVGEFLVQIVGVIIDHLVIVPRHDPRVRCMAGAQVGIGLVLGMARAVFVQLHRHPALVRTHDETRVGAFINVVTHKQHQVQIAFGHLAVHGKVALLVMLARRQRQPQALHRLVQCRAGAGAAHRAAGAAAHKAVPIMPPRLQTTGNHMHAVGPAGIGLYTPLAHRLAQGLIGKHLAQHGQTLCLERLVGIGHTQARPQHHAVGLGLATGHAQRKGIGLPTWAKAMGACCARLSLGLSPQPRRKGQRQRTAMQIPAR